jgi:putative transposase
VDLDTNNHSVFKLYYHLILVVKYRKNVINDEICNFAKSRFESIGKNYFITCEEFNHDRDHVHVLFRAHPKSDLVKFINAYKSSTSRMIKKEFPEVKDQLWESMFWTKSYCLLTSGGATIEVIKQYIEDQGKLVRK